MQHSHRSGFGPSGVIFCAFFTFAAIACAGTYSGGSGSAEDPYKISTVADWQELIAASADWSKQFLLLNDIDFGGINLTPVAPDTDPLADDYQGTPFNGSFDGAGHIFRHINIELASKDYVGLFGGVGLVGDIRNLGIDEAVILGRSIAGGLVGQNSGTVSDCTLTGDVSGDRGIGGMIGSNHGSASRLSSSGVISCWTGSGTGGLVGWNDYPGKLNGCFSKCLVDGSEIAGGLVGWNNGEITDCTAEGDVSGNTDVGGLVGWNASKIIQCRAAGNVSGMNDNTGGLIGTNMGSLVSECFSTGTVDGGNYTGGLSGISWGGTISRCYSTSNVSGYVSVGGLAGELHSITSCCFSTGKVSGDGYVGGFGGSSYSARIFDSYSTSEVSGNEYVGGLLGWINWGTIVHCYSTGAVQGKTKVGGLIGYIYRDTILDSFWDMQASGQSASAAGTGKTTVQMKDSNTYAKWGYCGDIWTIQEGMDYPHLQWQGLGGVPISVEFPWEGHGTEEDPYRIYSAEELDMLGQIPCAWDCHFVLMNDIDLSEYPGKTFHPIGIGWGEDQGFNGVFDGQNHSIHHFTYEGLDEFYVALFRQVSSAGTIQNVRMVDAYVLGNDYVGILVGQNRGTISNCSSTGEAAATYRSGGLVGVNWGVITRCFSIGTVSCQVWEAGGLVGYNKAGRLIHCYSKGSVSGNERIGGLVGWNDLGGIVRCYSSSKVTGTTDIGGLCGIKTAYEGYEDTGNFWDRQSSGTNKSTMGTGKTTEEMKTLATFTGAGWDFVGEEVNGTADVWRMCGDGVSYPRLSWEFSRGGDFACPDGVELEDLVYLAGRWMAGTPETAGAADGNGDGRVDMEDFAMMAENWMRM